MTFDDLPDDWADQPLTPTLLPDVTDLVLGQGDRSSGSLVCFMADPAAHLRIPLVVNEVPTACAREDIRAFLDRMVAVARHFVPGGCLGLGIGREGPPEPSEADTAWALQFTVACRRAGFTSLGVALATPDGVRRLDAAVAAA